MQGDRPCENTIRRAVERVKAAKKELSEVPTTRSREPSGGSQSIVIARLETLRNVVLEPSGGSQSMVFASP